jgi:predicted nucleic acid-binding protein
VIAYFDTSAFLKLVIEEPGSEQVAELWIAADSVVSSTLAYPEGRAALAMASRLGRMSATASRRARVEFEALVADLGLVVATTDLLRRAGDLAEAHALRGYDAVHLASAEAVADDETVLVTADQQLQTAATALGLATANLPN